MALSLPAVFLFYHIVEFACAVARPFLRRAQKAIKRIHRQGKTLVDAADVACANDRNEFGKVVLLRHTPFRSATTDVGHIWVRCNIDFQLMPRTLDPTSSLRQRCLLTVLHNPHINRRSSLRRIRNSLWQCTVCGYSSLIRRCCGASSIRMWLCTKQLTTAIIISRSIRGNR